MYWGGGALFACYLGMDNERKSAFRRDLWENLDALELLDPEVELAAREELVPKENVAKMAKWWDFRRH